jgi:drug/metabolite transporter (DMT)-like permease
MHLTVFVWGFTAILGRIISLSAVPLVWYRLTIVVVIMAALIWWRRIPLGVPRSAALRLIAAGAFVGLHWVFFYATIKHAGVAVAVLCLSSISFFTALFEPMVFRRSPRAIELILGLGVTAGVSVLVKVETNSDTLGLVMGLLSALFSAGFGSLNGRLALEVRGELMTLYELSTAGVLVSLYCLAFPNEFVAPWNVTASDALALAVLAVVCTVLPWLWSLRVLRTVSPYTVALAVSLEPVYSMALAYLLFTDETPLGWRFYLGTGILLALVAGNTLLKRFGKLPGNAIASIQGPVAE